MSNDISKALKNKTDAQLRLLEQDASPIVRESVSGENFISDPNEYSQNLLAGRNIIITISGNDKTINAVMGILAGDNISISEADEDGKVTIKGTLSGKDINIDDFVGKNGYVLSYDETGDQFILAEASSGVGSEYTLPQATEFDLGGIRAKEKTTETIEIAIDTSTGKLYVPAAEGGGSDLIVYSEGGYIVENFDSEEYKIMPSILAGWSKATAGYDNTNRLYSPSSNDTSVDYSIVIYMPTAGIVSFKHRQTFSYTQYTGLRVLVDGNQAYSTLNNNSTAWRTTEINVPQGTHTIKFTRASGSTSSLVKSELSIDDIQIPSDGVYGMDAVANNPQCFLLTASDGSYVGFKTISEIMERLQSDTLPTASENFRGQIFTLQGGTGVADASYICQKNASDAYIWQQI